MKSSRGVTRRYLPASPFNNPPPDPPVDRFTLRDRVNHDRYGLGTVIGVEDDVAVLIDFGTERKRILTPCAELFKL